MMYNQQRKKGFPYHKKRKKGARWKLDKRKNRRRESHCGHKENIPPIYTSQMTLTLPQQWQTHVSDDITHFVKIDSGKKEEMCQVSTSLSIHLDGTWSVFFVGHKIPKTNMSLGKFPNNITSIDVINQLIFVLNHASLCLGNSEEKYIDVCKRRKDEKISGERVW